MDRLSKGLAAFWLIVFAPVWIPLSLLTIYLALVAGFYVIYGLIVLPWWFVVDLISSGAWSWALLERLITNG